MQYLPQRYVLFMNQDVKKRKNISTYQLHICFAIEECQVQKITK